MARIRTIKPEFFTSEDIVNLTPLSRLFYVSLWLEADREGRLEWKPRTFKLRYFPADDCDIEAMGRELVEAGLIVLYDDKYAEIPSFAKHQVINNRESASEIPARVKVASPRVQAEGKEGRKGKEVASQDAPANPLPDWLPVEDWKSYLEMRVKIKKAPTDRAKALVIAELERLKAAGNDPATVLQKSIANNWVDVYPLKNQPAAGNPWDGAK